MFVDSDDWVDFQFVEKMFYAIDNSGADIAECDFYRVAMDSGIRSLSTNNQCMQKLFNKQERIIFGHITQWKML